MADDVGTVLQRYATPRAAGQTGPSRPEAVSGTSTPCPTTRSSPTLPTAHRLQGELHATACEARQKLLLREAGPVRAMRCRRGADLAPELERGVGPRHCREQAADRDRFGRNAKTRQRASATTISLAA